MGTADLRGCRRGIQSATAAAATTGILACARGFVERYDLPLPLSYFLAGTSAAVALSFVVVAAAAIGAWGDVHSIRIAFVLPFALLYDFLVRVAVRAVGGTAIVAGHIVALTGLTHYGDCIGDSAPEWACCIAILRAGGDDGGKTSKFVFCLAANH